jgi:hypothetical protein
LVAGALAASALHGDALDRRTLLEVCNAIEGHPDNLAPALYGGLTASMLEDGKPYTVRYTAHSSLHFVVVIPDFELSTHKARGVLPKAVPYADAVYNVSHAAVLLRAIETGDGGSLPLHCGISCISPTEKNSLRIMNRQSLRRGSWERWRIVSAVRDRPSWHWSTAMKRRLLLCCGKNCCGLHPAGRCCRCPLTPTERN